MKLSVLLCLAVVLAVAVALPAPLTAVGLAPVGLPFVGSMGSSFIPSPDQIQKLQALDLASATAYGGAAAVPGAAGLTGLAPVGV